MTGLSTTLATTRSSVPELLMGLADQDATGCLTVVDEDGQEAEVWLRGGEVYSVQAPGPRPMLGVRLMSTGVVTPEVLALALEEQRRQRPPQRLGEVLIGLGVIEPEVVEAFLIEQQADVVADLLDWHVVSCDFRDGDETGAGLTRPVGVSAILAQARHRASDWSEVVDGVGGADVVPMLATRSDDAVDVVLGPTDWALLCKIDGQRSLRSLAADCGFTVIEAAQVVAGLHAAGLVDCGPGDAGFRAPPTAPEPWESDLAGVTAALQAVLARSAPVALDDADAGGPDGTAPDWVAHAVMAAPLEDEVRAPADDLDGGIDDEIGDDPDDGDRDDGDRDDGDRPLPAGPTLRLVTDDWVDDVIDPDDAETDAIAETDDDETDDTDDADDDDGDAEALGTADEPLGLDAPDDVAPDHLPAAEPMDTDPTDAAVTDTAVTDTAVTDTAVTDTDPTDTDPTGTDPTGTDVTETHVTDGTGGAPPLGEVDPEVPPERVYTVLPSATRMPVAQAPVVAPPPPSAFLPAAAAAVVAAAVDTAVVAPGPVPTTPPAPDPLPAPVPPPVPASDPVDDDLTSVLTAALSDMALPDPLGDDWRAGRAATVAPEPAPDIEPAATAPPSVVPEPTPAYPPADLDDVTDEAVEMTDTAALMRELSSLSAAEPEVEDGWARPAGGRSADPTRRKRRGLFGR